jgi:hypothetical protein
VIWYLVDGQVEGEGMNGERVPYPNVHPSGLDRLILASVHHPHPQPEKGYFTTPNVVFDMWAQTRDLDIPVRTRK